MEDGSNKNYEKLLLKQIFLGAVLTPGIFHFSQEHVWKWILCRKLVYPDPCIEICFCSWFVIILSTPYFSLVGVVVSAPSSLFLNTKVVKYIQVGLFLIYIAFGSTVLENSPWNVMKVENYCFAREVRSCPTLSCPLPNFQFIPLTLPHAGQMGPRQELEGSPSKTKLLDSVPSAGSVLHVKLASNLSFTWAVLSDSSVKKTEHAFTAKE